MVEQTFVALKPDTVQRGLIGEILKRFENAGLKISGLKMRWVTKDFAKQHYKSHVKKAFYNGLEKFITEGPVIAMVVEGVCAVETVRKIVGSTEPKTAAPGTIRGDFAHHSYNYTDKKKIAIKNLIHASENKKEAQYEIGLWFTDDEIHKYKTTHEKHTQ
ncbi:nucleoside-diphosphate kinase [Candidatus Woesearchaeota archaeon]|nr:nucleoside-diphosphate kinase [Candidatus Woesearchaeota archaeon]